MSIPRRIDTHAIITDIRSGMGDIAIMEKYLISADELMAILHKLERAKAIEKTEVERRMPSLREKSDAVQLRSVPRNYIFMTVHIHDAKDPKLGGVLNDISAKGLQVIGIDTQVGEIRTFFVRSDVFKLETALGLEAVCRWVQTDENSGKPVAGFEIRRVSKGAKEELLRLIQELTIGESF
ncbi:MAG: PilZ domain-containing protein [Thermodesulfobacteriota bacterium]